MIVKLRIFDSEIDSKIDSKITAGKRRIFAGTAGKKNELRQFNLWVKLGNFLSPVKEKFPLVPPVENLDSDCVMSKIAEIF